jgi:hypothetical protein
MTPKRDRDVQMTSPVYSPSLGLQGASRITGGIFRGRAEGNVFNFADAPHIPPPPEEYQPSMGKVLVYVCSDDPNIPKPNPSTTKPTMSLSHQVTETIAPILVKLERKYSATQSTIVFPLPLKVLLTQNPQLNEYMSMRTMIGMSKVNSNIMFFSQSND